MCSMTDWSKYPVLRARVTPELEDAVTSAANDEGLTTPEFLRLVLQEATSEDRKVLAAK